LLKEPAADGSKGQQGGADNSLHSN
jgi:hypothetical protein